MRLFDSFRKPGMAMLVKKSGGLTCKENLAGSGLLL